MRKPEKEKNQTRKASKTKESYHNSSRKSNEKRRSAAEKCSRTHRQRKERVLQAIPIEEAATRLQPESSATCPYCHTEKSLSFPDDCHFHCCCCGKEGDTIRLVSKVFDWTYWPALKWLEANAEKPADVPISESSDSPHEEKESVETEVGQFEWPAPVYREEFRERVERVKRDCRLEEVISSMTQAQFKRVGENLFCCCPFSDHMDKTPSFAVHPGKQSFYCFGCTRGGDIFTFIEIYQKCRFLEALNFLDPNGTGESSVGSLTLPSPQTTCPTARRVEIVTRCRDFFHRRLLQSQAAQEFLATRGLREKELVETFKVGFDDGRINQAISCEVAGDLKSFGMVNNKSNSRFYQCLTVGLEDGEGNIVSLYGRRISSEKANKHQFPCGQIDCVFNARAFKASQEIILTEGVLDALSLFLMGLMHVSCVFSVANIPPLLFDLIKRCGIKRVFLALDNDAAGDKACGLLAEKLLTLRVEVRRVQLPKGIKDTNEMLVEMGREKASACFCELLAEALHLGEKKASTTEESPAIVLSPAISTEVNKEQIVFTIADRRYRIRGLAKNLSFDSMRVNLSLFLGEKFHVDTFDLYNARHRSSFIKTASEELAVNLEIIKHDVGQIFLKLEEFQEQQIKETLKTEEQPVEMTAEERAEALELLQAPDLVERIARDIERCGLVGERINGLVMYFAATSRLLDDPLCLIIQSLSAGGKSSMLEIILSLMPEEEKVKFSAMTGQSLFYMGETNLKHKILAISEEEGAEKASYALKIMQSEKELTIASTSKDPKSGRHTTGEYRVEGPVQTMLTTTAEQVDEELENRGLLLTANEKREQTRAIHDLQRERETISGIFLREDRELIVKLHQNAQRLLRPVMVVNPYAKKLTFFDHSLRTRRDHVKYLTLIRAIALLHQYQRPVKTIRHNGRVIEYIEVIPRDIEIANSLVHHVLGTSLDELPPQTRRMLNLLWQMVEEESREKGIDPTAFRFTQRQVREYTRWRHTQTKIHIARLVEMEYLYLHRSKRGVHFEYEMVYQGEGKDGSPFLAGLLDPKKLTTPEKPDLAGGRG